MTDNTTHLEQQLTVITTHINADFDAMASLLAAQKLYPGAVVVFSRLPGKKSAEFFYQFNGLSF